MAVAIAEVDQNTQRQEAYCVKIAPRIRPTTKWLTIKQLSNMMMKRSYLLFATPAHPPSTAIASACSAGSGKVLTSSVSAEGIVNAAPISPLRRLLNKLQYLTLTDSCQCT